MLITTMESFIAMYRPHAAREDTDLFPKLKTLVSPNEYDAMAEEFEEIVSRCFALFDPKTEAVPLRRRWRQDGY